MRGLLLALLLAVCPAQAFARDKQQEEECFAIVGTEGQLRYEMVPGYSISAQTPPLSPPPVSAHLSSIACLRESLRLAPNDLRVLSDLNVPLMVMVIDDSDDRMLELDGAGLRVSGGRITPEERATLRQAYEQMSAALEQEGTAP